MADKPIPFSVEMVQALLAGRKTQTRRMLKPQPIPELCWRDAARRYPISTGWGSVPFAPGDRLYVREPWQALAMHNGKMPSEIPVGSDVLYVADRPDMLWDARKRHARFMMRWMSRLTLIVTDVRVERVQDISEEDAKAEGAFWTDYGRKCFHKGSPKDATECDAPQGTHPIRDGWSMVETTSHEQCLFSPRYAFANLWNTLHKPGFQWDDNPWCCAITFEVHQANIDAMKEAA